ncbi:MFS transporter [Methanobacterium ferruginis]|uniref:MFS transporter n=1 Tax=Methanobacterium ferruginis TaxID=710191 RepID=UPI002572A9A9|nr:MFS transporter [Methanobacterium ferruginis]
MLCGLSQSMMELILFRGVQGFAGGLLMMIPLKLLGELLPPGKRSMSIGILSAVSSISTIVGPTVGGLITDTLGWNWVFFINVPIGAFVMILLWKYLPNMGKDIKQKIFDYKGLITYIICLSTLLLALTIIQQGDTTPTLTLVALFACAAVMLLGFIWSERNAEEPLLPLHLFKNNIFTISAVCMFLIGTLMLSSTTYIPLFLQKVQGMTASSAGIFISPLFISTTIMSILGGKIIQKTDKYKVMILASFVFFITGMGLLSTMTISTTTLEVVVYSSLVGIGLGFSFPQFTVISQSAVEKQDLGVVTGSIQLFRMLGNVIGLTILGVIVNMTLGMGSANSQVSPLILNNAIGNVFFTGLIIAIAGFLMCLLLKEIHMDGEVTH